MTPIRPPKTGNIKTDQLHQSAQIQRVKISAFIFMRDSKGVKREGNK